MASPPSLPKLYGSPKQVAWAEKIRAGYLAAMDRHEREIHEALLHSRTMRRQVAHDLRRQGRVFEWIRRQRAAKWWIENRGLDVNGIAMAAWAQMTQRPSAFGRLKSKDACDALRTASIATAILAIVLVVA